MSKRISFMKALRKGIIKPGDLFDPIRLFPKEQKEVVLEPFETGWKEHQTYTREILLWYLARDKKGKYVLCGSTTETKLNLRGQAGYENGIQAQNKICDLYSNPDFNFTARTMDQEDFEVFQNEQWLKKDKKPSWLGSRSIKIKDACYIRYSMCCVKSDSLKKISLFESYGPSYDEAYGVHPIISIPDSKLVVDVATKNEFGAWKLIYNK